MPQLSFTWLTSLFRQSKAEIESKNPLRKPRTSPALVDWTDNHQINGELTRGLYHNTFPGFKLAGGLAFVPIAVPVWFMGFPIPAPNDENDNDTKEELKELIDNFSTEIEMIHTECHREGTIWVWPHWSSKSMRLIWEFIHDDIVTDIVRDLDTGEIVAIWTSESITMSTDFDKTVVVERKRKFTRQTIEISYSTKQGTLPGNLRDVTKRNVLNSLPIPFANNADSNHVRGHSDYERILTDLKDYHDIDLARSTMLAKFNPKMVQTVKNVDSWIKNQSLPNDDISELDVSGIDLILNVEGESTEFAFPERADVAYKEGLVQKFQKIVEASGIPELLWGLKIRGNNATAEESMSSLVKFVRNKQIRKNDSYSQLFRESLRIMRAVNMDSREVPAIRIGWDDLDSVSDKIKSEIFLNFSNGLSKLQSTASLTKDQIYKLWAMLYPKVTPPEEDKEQFFIDLSSTAQLNQYNNESYVNALDFSQEAVDVTNDSDEE